MWSASEVKAAYPKAVLDGIAGTISTWRDDAAREELLRLILNWATSRRQGVNLPKLRSSLQRLAKAAGALVREWDRQSNYAAIAVASELGDEFGSGYPMTAEIENAVRFLSDVGDAAADAAISIDKQKRSRPRGEITSYDIAKLRAIFERVTGRKPGYRRGGNNGYKLSNNRPAGEFVEFVRASTSPFTNGASPTKAFRDWSKEWKAKSVRSSRRRRSRKQP